MTLNAPITLDQYFHQIIKQPLVKEQTMFERTKMFFTQSVEKINSLLTRPVAFVEEDPKALGI
jgi:glutathionyl-hydroquinone reductase